MNDATNTTTAQTALNDAQKSARSRRNAFIGWGLLAYVVLIFMVTVARLGGGGLQLDKLAQ